MQLYFIWVTGTHRHFEWLLDILREVEEVDVKRVVSIDIFITQFFQNFDLRTAMLVGGIYSSTFFHTQIMSQSSFCNLHWWNLIKNKTITWKQLAKKMLNAKMSILANPHLTLSSSSLTCILAIMYISWLVDQLSS